MNYVSDNSKAANGFRLGRWHVPDPANPNGSPFVGMGNNGGISISGNTWKLGGGNGGHRDGGGTTFQRPVKQPPRKQTPAELAAITKGKELRARLVDLESRFAQYQSAKRAAEKKVQRSHSQGGNTVQKTSTTASIADIATGVADQTLKDTRIGSNIAYRMSGSPKLISGVNGSIKYVPYVGLVVTVLSGYYLSTANDPATGQPYQSWAQAGTDVGVNFGTFYIGATLGGWSGAFGSLIYMGSKLNVQYCMRNGQNPGMIFVLNKE